MKRLIILSFTVLVVGCGKKTNDSKSGVTNWTTTNLSMNPVKLKKQNKRCESRFSVDDNIRFNLYQFIKGERVLESLNFNGQIRDNYVRNLTAKPISKTYYGADSKIVFDATFNPIDQNYYETTNTKSIEEKEGTSKKLSVCKDTETYGSFTYEGAGLNVSNVINQTYEAITAADNKLSLDPVEVNIAPIQYIDVKFRGGPNNLERTKGYSTDNAYYSPSDKTITFLPQSKEYQEAVGDIPFWEIPTAAAHEYGHHVFQTLIINKTQANIKHSLSCYQNHTTLKNLHLTVLKDVRDNGMDFALGSINEGFADLISFYSLDKKQRSLKGVICFQKNREVGSAIFGSYDKKIFNTEALAAINNKNSLVPDRKCETPDYQEIHNVGAIFAYGANELISEIAISRKEKMVVVLAWAQSFAKEYDSLKDLEAGEVLFAALELMYKTAIEKSGMEIESKACEKMDKMFPDNSQYKCRYLE